MTQLNYRSNYLIELFKHKNNIKFSFNNFPVDAINFVSDSVYEYCEKTEHKSKGNRTFDTFLYHSFSGQFTEYLVSIYLGLTLEQFKKCSSVEARPYDILDNNGNKIECKFITEFNSELDWVPINRSTFRYFDYDEQNYIKIKYALKKVWEHENGGWNKMYITTIKNGHIYIFADLEWYIYHAVIQSSGVDPIINEQLFKIKCKGDIEAFKIEKQKNIIKREYLNILNIKLT